MQKETTWNNDSITNSDMISENDIISEGSPQKNNNNQRTHSRSSGKLKDTLITQFLNPILPRLLNTLQTMGGGYFTPLLICLFFALEA